MALQHRLSINNITQGERTAGHIRTNWFNGESSGVFTTNEQIPICDFHRGWCWDLYAKTFVSLPRAYHLRHAERYGDTTPFTDRIPVQFSAPPKKYHELRAAFDWFLSQTHFWKSESAQNNSLWLYEWQCDEPCVRRVFIHNAAIIDEHIRERSTDGKWTSSPYLEFFRHYCFESVKPVFINTGNDPFIQEALTDDDGNEVHPYPLAGLNHRCLQTAIINPHYMIGTEHGRICWMGIEDTVSNPVLETADPDDSWGNLHNLWVGIKRDYGCGLDDWFNILPMSYGRQLTDDATVYTNNFADGGDLASNPDAQYPNVPAGSGCGSVRPDGTDDGTPLGQGRAVGVNFTTTTNLVARTQICLSDIIPNAGSVYEQWRGRYILLARVAPSNLTDPADPNSALALDSATFTVTAAYGWAGTQKKTETGTTQVVEKIGDRSDFRYINLGMISMPPDEGRLCDEIIPVAGGTSTTNLASFCIDVHVGRERGDSGFTIDHLKLIPAEHFAKIDITNQDFSLIPQNESLDRGVLWLTTNEDDSTNVRYELFDNNALTNNNRVSADIEHNTDTFFMPFTGSRIVFAANQRRKTLVEEDDRFIPIAAALDWELRADFLVYPRWLSLCDKDSDETSRYPLSILFPDVFPPNNF